jgi:hypothetical protein
MKTVHVKQTKEWRDAFRGRGGVFVRLPLDSEAQELIRRLHGVYGTETLLDLLKIGLNLLESQAREAPPPEFMALDGLREAAMEEEILAVEDELDLD